MAKVTPKVKTLFVDIGGVLLTDGWNRHVRKRAAKKFALDLVALEDRHHVNVDIYELGKLSLHDYLSRVVFYEKRNFTRTQFWKFMIGESKALPQMLELVRDLKLRHNLKLGVVSNEARELNEHRIREFQLDSLFDFFICSSLVHLRKPDMDFFRMALDVAQTPAAQIVYLENTPLFVELAGSLGIHAVLHTDYRSTCAKLSALGLDSGKGDL